MPRKTRERVEVEAEVTIGCWTSNSRDEDRHGFRITVEDKISGTTLVEVEMSPAEFALALASHGNRPAKATYYRNPFVGKRREHKTIGLEISEDHDTKARRLAAAKEAAKEFEDGGWRADHSNVNNQHYCSRDHERGVIVVTTHFHRHVDPKTGEPVIIGEQEDAEG